MKRTRAVLAASAAALTIATGLGLASSAAHARAECYYKGFDTFKNFPDYHIDGYATAAKKSWACNKAKNRCLNELRRAWKKGYGKHVRCQRVR